MREARKSGRVRSGSNGDAIVMNTQEELRTAFEELEQNTFIKKR
jgi:redox-sensitive bicupin YhaK (pirin superfamily)